MNDLFSKQAAEYAKYRPTYPKELYACIFKHVKNYECAWDCGTGNGQAAIALAQKFKRVYATDLSATQIKHAKPHSNVVYSVCTAEDSGFPSHSFDLVTVAQALHWFNFELFYPELKRVLKTGGIFAAWSYGLARVTTEVDAVVDFFYNTLTAPYWNSRRYLIDEKYQTIPFPLKKIDTPPMNITLEWSLDHFINYMAKTWSAVQTYIQQHNSNPIELIRKDLEQAWGNSKQLRVVTWPIYLLMGSF